MRLENQVCTIEQAKKLKELRIFGNSQWYYTVIGTPNGNKTMLSLSFDNAYIVMGAINGQIMPHYDETVPKEIYPAFTVAELGVMLPDAIPHKNGGMAESYDVYFGYGIDYLDRKLPMVWYDDIDLPETKERLKSESGNTEAEARAAMLIYLLESGHITPQEVNERLNR